MSDGEGAKVLRWAARKGLTVGNPGSVEVRAMDLAKKMNRCLGEFYLEDPKVRKQAIRHLHKWIDAEQLHVLLKEMDVE